MSIAASLKSVLPAPTSLNGGSTSGKEPAQQAGPSSSVIKKLKDQSVRIPAYGERDGWVPRTAEDYGDGGAFPEIDIPQFPLEMGRNVHRALVGRNQGALVPVTVNAEGRTRYDAIVRQGHAPGAVVHTGPGAAVGRVFSEEELERPGEEEVKDTVERTRRAIQAKLGAVLVETNASAPNSAALNTSEPQLVRYSAAATSAAHASGASQRLVKIVEKKVDPLEPSKFRVQTSATLLDVDAPVPVLHDAPKKLTKAEADAWNIPVSFSNWNSRGFTIGLDKREVATASASQDLVVSSKFATMAAALDTAQQSAREQVAYRARLEQQRQLQQRELEDQQAREIARQARLKRAGIYAEAEATETESERQARLARDAMRAEMRKDVEEESRRERMGARAKAATAAPKTHPASGERDISEKIALGQMVPRQQETLFDSRLFNQTQGLDHGFVNEEEYNLYDRPLLSTGREEALFRGLNQREGEVFQEEFSVERFKKDGFRGSGPRSSSGPVQFERDEEAAHQQRMEEIERQRSLAEQARQRSSSPPRSSSAAPSRYPSTSDYPSPPRRRGDMGSPPRGRPADSPPRRGARDSYPSPPRRSDRRDYHDTGDYPSPPRRRSMDGGASPQRSRDARADDPMDSMLSFMSDAKSRKRDREDAFDGSRRGPLLGHMHAVGGSSGTVEDYRDSKRSKVSFVSTRTETTPHEISEEARRRDEEMERRSSSYSRRYDDDDRPLRGRGDDREGEQRSRDYDRRGGGPPPFRGRAGSPDDYDDDRGRGPPSMDDRRRGYGRGGARDYGDDRRDRDPHAKRPSDDEYRDEFGRDRR